MQARDARRPRHQDGASTDAARPLVRPLVSIVSPCFDEVDVIRLFHRELSAVVDTIDGHDFEVLYVDDGSDDGTLRVSVGEGEIALPRPASGLKAGAAVTLGIRPEHIDVADGSGMITATVDLVEHLGGDTFIYASAPGLPQITLRQDGQSPFHRGNAIAIRFTTDHLHIFDETGAALARP